jgi:hypothetical protein
MDQFRLQQPEQPTELPDRDRIGKWRCMPLRSIANQPRKSSPELPEPVDGYSVVVFDAVRATMPRNRNSDIMAANS